MSQEPERATSGASVGRKRRVESLVAACVCLAWALALAWTLPDSPSYGWDESMHAQLPAARMLLAVQHGEFGAAAEALLGCAQYPFVWPVCLALVQAVFGLAEHAARIAGIAAFGVGLFALFACVRVCSAGSARLRGAPWIALALAASSPLWVSYSGTLFLEVPFAAAACAALWAWTRRSEQSTPQRELVAGLLLAVCVFVKWNYGLLLAAGLGLDWTIELALALRHSRTHAFLRRSVWLAAIPLASVAWWFLLPLPGGFELAHEHRAALAGFLAGNQSDAPVPAARRWFYASVFLGYTPRVFVLLLVGLTSSLRLVSTPGPRALACALLTSAVPVCLHPFHLDRFQIPFSAPLFALASLGIAALLPLALRARVVVAALVLLAVVLAPNRDVPLAGRVTGQLATEPNTRAYQLDYLTASRTLLAGRRLPSHGLERDEAQGILDAIAGAVGPTQRVAWLGISSELSPAALHLGLLERGGARERFVTSAHEPMDVTYFGKDQDPHWSDAQLLAFVERFDVVLWTRPVDLKARDSRAFMAAYQDRLGSRPDWQLAELGRFEIRRPLSAPLSVTLFACRRKT